MTQNSLDIAALLCSKLCHDLLSPVGAINNGLELLEDETDPEMRDRCLELLSDSAVASANKLKYFRLAFGAAGGFGDQVDPAEAKQLVESLVGDQEKIALGWAVQSATLPKKAVKILLNLAMIAREALVRGGRLDVGAEAGEQGTEVVVRAEGPKIALDEGIRAALEGTLADSDLSARTAAAWMSRELALQNNGDLRVSPPAESELLLGAIVAG
ncbi:histidine phosphotransferase ChpT [Parasphingorhabdus marina DSM 22363]|uniref:Histidine phosphotransferase ChpT n=1 Tax=Parasphingorhabdus marina DSM 22363 TaxID=1123272 RepID=A0A1N6FH28_9SPHN|nr:histidine phosphotransferase family protein [Parasphingorhabdus marina]SIN94581.1 histidine phosphotransferase ChpT [Parasphingorhabdus marina DSM 22363]